MEVSQMLKVQKAGHILWRYAWKPSDTMKFSEHMNAVVWSQDVQQSQKSNQHGIFAGPKNAPQGSLWSHKEYGSSWSHYAFMTHLWHIIAYLHLLCPKRLKGSFPEMYLHSKRKGTTGCIFQAPQSQHPLREWASVFEKNSGAKWALEVEMIYIVTSNGCFLKW